MMPAADHARTRSAKSDISRSKSTPTDSKRANVRSSAEVTRAKSLEMDAARAKLFSAAATCGKSVRDTFWSSAEVIQGTKSVKRSSQGAG
jgi:hypothetical protein